MEIIVRGQHFDVPEQVEEHARSKLARLAHYLPLLSDAAVEVDVTHEQTKKPDLRYAVRVAVNGKGVHLRAEERAARLNAAVDQAAHVLTGQARRHKQRLYGRGRKSAAKEVARAQAEAATGSATGSLADSLARVKHFPMKPMTTVEALEQLEALGHDFYLFFDSDAAQVSLVYRRRAGDYGLIIPELP